MARVLFVEAFYGGSHRAFADGLRTHSSHEITLLTLPPGEWRARMRRGAHELAAALDGVPGSFDFVVATDMVDLAAFIALTRRRLGGLPVMLYMHENQFTYPRLRGTKLNSWFGQINYLSACAADNVAFNSEFHQTDFLDALRTLERQPNNWLASGAITTIERKSRVLPVGVELDWLDALGPRPEAPAGQPPLIVWNHRWEFDKAPDVFARAMRTLASDGISFRLALAGEPGPNPSPDLAALSGTLGERVVHRGMLADREAYGRLLLRGDIVVSTARHEFFGIGMVEAMYAGCVPLAPAKYNYPALVPAALHRRCLYTKEAELLERLQSLLAARPDPEPIRASAARFAWPRVIVEWDEALESLASGLS
jgi:glycosyltransferase involved in cell wall biosynthesis